nr:zinc finger, CCHC-type [Tanacetum cinerariifolium]
MDDSSRKTVETRKMVSDFTKGTARTKLLVGEEDNYVTKHMNVVSIVQEEDKEIEGQVKDVDKNFVEDKEVIEEGSDEDDTIVPSRWGTYKDNMVETPKSGSIRYDLKQKLTRKQLIISMSVVIIQLWIKSGEGPNGTMMIMSAEDTLEAKYMAEDASSKKFLISNFINYKMTDSRPVLEQYNELLGRFTKHKINMDESIQVSCIIDKLPLSWKDFKHTLKHMKEELTLVELGSHLRIEESLRVQDNDKPKGNNVVGPSVVNMVEHNNSSRIIMLRGGLTLEQLCMCVKIDAAFMSTSKLNDSILWHARLCHVHFKRMQDMSKDRLIPAFDMDTKKWNKKYFVTFIDDASSSIYLQLSFEDSFEIQRSATWRAVVKLPGPKLKTLVEKGIKCIFVGYDEHSKAFRFYVIEPNDSVAINSIIESRDVIFEHMFLSVPRPSQRSLKDGTEDSGGSMGPEKVTDEIVHQSEPELRKSKRHRTPKDFGTEFQLYLIEGTRDESDYSSDGCGDIFLEWGIRIGGLLAYLLSLPTANAMSGLAVSQLEYSRVIGCLMYAITCTSPDIAFAVGKLSRYASNPGTRHWQAIQRIINSEDYSSTSGWVFLLSGGVISWASKKQTCITGLTIEYEFVALVAIGKEVEWLKNLLLEIPPWVKPMAPISICCDSVATLAKAYCQMYNGKSRHLGVKHSMIRELIRNEVISIEFRAEAHVLQIIPRMCLEPADMEDEVANFLMVNFLKKVLSRNMNKEEPHMVKFIPVDGGWSYGVYTQRSLNTLTLIVVKREFMYLMKFRGADEVQ